MNKLGLSEVIATLYASMSSFQIHLSAVNSELHEQIKKLTQEMTLIKEKLLENKK